MTLVAGSYEKYLFGWRVNQKNKDGEQQGSLKTMCTYSAHMGPIKCIAMAGPVVVTGGTDDTIKIFDITAWCEMGSLFQHKGAITSLCLYGGDSSASAYPKNLLSGSEDGTICIWDADLWLHLKTMKAHKRGVNDLAIHPSGRLALSVGRDSHMSMFNLLNGRCTFTSKLQKEATLIEFNPKGGDKYSMVTDDIVYIHSAEDARLLHSLVHSQRVLCLAPTQNGLLLTGGEDCTIRAWDVVSGKIGFSIKNAHKSRIKGLAVLGLKSNIDSEDTPYLVASASSDGLLRIWDVRMAKEENPVPLMETDTKARLTCIAGRFTKAYLAANIQGKLDIVEQDKSLASSDAQSKTKQLNNLSSDGIDNEIQHKSSVHLISGEKKSIKHGHYPEKLSAAILKQNKKFKVGLMVKTKTNMKLKGFQRHTKGKDRTKGKKADV